MANLLSLPKVAATGSSDTNPRPELYHNMPGTGRSCPSLNKSSLISRESARLALRLKQIHEERAIQQRAIEIERRAFALERKILEEKYKILEQQIRKKSSSRKRTNASESTADGIPLSAPARTASDTTMHREPQFEKLTIQPIGIESSADRLQVLGTQQLISSAFPKADLRKQHLFADSSERWNETICISRSPYGAPSSSEFNSKDTAGRSDQLCHEAGQHQTQCILIEMPSLVQLHQYEDTYEIRTVVCASKELTVIEINRNEHGPTLREIRMFCIPLYLDTGQNLEKIRSAQSGINNVEAKLSLFCAKKIDLLVTVRHNLEISLLSYVFVECQNAMINHLVPNVLISNFAKLSILRGLLVYTSTDQYCGQQGFQTNPATILTAEHAPKRFIAKLQSSASGSTIPTTLEHDKSSTSSKISPKTNLFLLVSCSDSSIWLCDAVNNTQHQKHYHDAPVLDCPFCYSVRTIIAGLDNPVELNDSNTHAECIVGSHDAGVNCVEYSCKANGILTISWYKTVLLWDTQGNDWVGKVEQNNGKVYSMSCIDRQLVVATSEPKVLVWDSSNMGQYLNQMESSLKFQIRAIRYFPNKEHYMMSSTEDRVAVVVVDMNAEVQKKKFDFKCHRSKENNLELIYTVIAVCFHHVFNTSATGGSDENDLKGQAATRNFQHMFDSPNKGVCTHVLWGQVEHNVNLKSLDKANKDDDFELVTYFRTAKDEFRNQSPPLKGIDLEKLSPPSNKMVPSKVTWDGGGNYIKRKDENVWPDHDFGQLSLHAKHDLSSIGNLNGDISDSRDSSARCFEEHDGHVQVSEFSMGANESKGLSGMALCTVAEESS